MFADYGYQGATSPYSDRLVLEKLDAAFPIPASVSRARYLKARRYADILIALVALPSIVILVALAAIAIVITMGRPILFVQDRVGVKGRVFRIFKLRTMSNASSASASATSVNDKRVTPLGHFLRKTHIDELPQLWNILKGDMTFIGPRPEQVGLVEQYRVSIPHYDLRHTITPGLSGWAQVRFGYAADAQETRSKLEYDLYYVKNVSLMTDLKIVWLTFSVYLNPRFVR